MSWFDGSRLSEAEMRRGAARSAPDDRALYFGGDLRAPDGRWPAAMDDAFFRAADDLRTDLDFGLVQRVAGGPLTRLGLREREIALLAATPLFGAGPSPSGRGSRWRQARSVREVEQPRRRHAALVERS